MSTKHRATQIKKAIESIREFHEMGQSLPPVLPHVKAYRQNIIASEAVKRGIDEDTIRKARQFATSYTSKSLETLFRQIRMHQLAQDANAAIFRKCHVIRLLSISNEAERDEFQQLAIEGAWSTSELEAQIAARFGTRRAGGRTARSAKSTVELMTQIEAFCESWYRWHKVATRSERPENEFSLRQLPASVQNQVRAVNTELNSLHIKVTSAIRKCVPGFQARQHLITAKKH